MFVKRELRVFTILFFTVAITAAGTGCQPFSSDVALSSLNSSEGPIGGGRRPSGSATAQTFVQGLKLGINIERGAFGMGDLDTSLAGFEYFKSLGLTHVRFFYPWRPSLNMGGSAGVDVPPTREQFSQILPAIRNASQAGLKVLVDFCDVMGVEDFEGARQQMVDAYVTMAAEIVAGENFDPARVAFGAVNEWAGGVAGAYDEGNNPVYNGHRRRLNAILRSRLPNHVLITGPAYWKYYEQLLKPDFEMAADANFIYDVHSYDFNAGDPNHIRDVSARLQAWSRARNAPVVYGESGFGFNNDRDVNSWTNVIGVFADHLLPVYPTLWAVTYGGSWRMNRGDNDYRLEPVLEQALRQAAQ